MHYPERVSIFEVGPRDGLQNESQPLSVAQKVQVIESLQDIGCQRIEAGSFVSPKWVPQMADSAKVFTQIKRQTGVVYSALTPNLRGLEDAIAVGVDEVAVFAGASEAFSQKNINCSIAESIERFKPVLALAQHHSLPVRGYVSTVLGCPYQGEVDIHQVKSLTETLLTLGCYEVSLGDTIGVGTPKATAELLSLLTKDIPVDRLAVHFHNTYGQALANILIALQHGVTTIDSAIAGLGGCPYAKGASGNVATEDVVYMCENMGIDTGIDLAAAVDVSKEICTILKKPVQSNVSQAL
jgi:hydroxymethylglutaryl-CoA lyase